MVTHDYTPPVRHLLASDVAPVQITTDTEAGIARSDTGHTWHQSADESPEQLHARAVRTIQLVQDGLR
jgi:hypothetical protein